MQQQGRAIESFHFEADGTIGGPDQILRELDLRPYDALSNSQRDRLRKDGLYPPAFKLSPDPKSWCVGFSRNEILAWQAAVQAGASMKELRALIVRMKAKRLGRLDADGGRE